MRFTPRMAFGRWGESPELDDARMRMALEFLVLINVAILRRNPHLPGLYQAGLRYGFAPAATCTAESCDDDWCDLLAVLEQGGGDCEELAAYRVAELRERLGVPAFIDFTKAWNERMRRNEYHIFVRYPDGRTEDPSRALGMTG